MSDDSSVLQRPTCLSKTARAKFLRALNVLPNAPQEVLETAAQEFNERFGFDATWEEMPAFIVGAWKSNDSLSGPSSQKDKLHLRRPIWLLRH